MALDKALELLPTLIIDEAKDWQDVNQIKDVIKTSVMSKQYGKEDYITDLVCNACCSILPANAAKNNVTFNVDNVRVCKILGSGLHSSQVCTLKANFNFL